MADGIIPLLLNDCRLHVLGSSQPEYAPLITSFFDFDFEIWDKIIHDCETEKIQYYLEQGNNLLRFKKRLIEKLVKEAKLVKFENYSALEVNSPLFHSEIGND